MAIRYRNDNSRHIRTLGNHPPVLPVDRRDPPLFSESLKIHANNNVNLTGKNIQFCEEREIVMLDDFQKHSAETISYIIFHCTFSRAYTYRYKCLYLINFVTSCERKFKNLIISNYKSSIVSD